MRNITKVTLLAIVLLAVAACQPIYPPTLGVDLAGTSWVLSSLDGDLPLPGTSVTLDFGADGSVSGSDGCNQFSTTFTQDADSLTINQPTASTMMACAEPIMDQAAAYATALAETTNFSATQRQLTLKTGDQILATFVIITQDLAGTEWEVIAYNNGREAVVGLLTGTEISADFGEEGELSGNAGCNQYFGGFSVDDNAIEIGPVGATLRFCDDPPGVMEQESEYLAALESAATFSIRGNLLEMRTADDAIAVMMTRKLVVDLPPPAPAPTPATATGRVAGTQSLNIRSGPGVNFPVIGFARLGDEGEIVGRSADARWWAVSVPSAPDGIGWVSADFVIATNADDVPVIAPSAPVVVPTAVTPPVAPTPVPPPTATPSAELSFWAERTNLNQGQCTRLNWSVEHVQAVWVYPQGERYDRFPRTGQGSEQVCPTSTTTYEMRVLLRDGSTVFREVTINVTPAPPTATPTPAPPPPTATPAPTPDRLAGTRWEVVNYNNGQGALVSLIADTRISVDFGTDGQITGSAGCNTYFAPYQVTGNAITISEPGATQTVCAEPEGVMEQEAEFLAALQTAATFSIDGDTLEMRTASDQIAIVATQVP